MSLEPQPRILIWSQYFWPERFLVNQIAVGLVKRGFKVTVLTGQPNYPGGKTFPGYRAYLPARECWEGVEVVRIPLVPRFADSFLGISANYLSFVASGLFLAPLLLCRKRFDLVFLYAPSPVIQAIPGIVLAMLKGLPRVLWVQDLWPDALSATGYVRPGFITRAVSILVTWLYEASSLVLLQSEAFKRVIECRIRKPVPMAVFPNFADPNLFRAPVGWVPTGIEKEIAASFSIVFAGNLGKAQSIDTILQAAQLLSVRQSIKFFLVGTGSEAKRVAEEIARLSLANVFLTGEIPETKIGGVYAAASALLITLASGESLSRTVPSKYQGYLAAGKPVLVAADGEVARLVELHDVGLHCKSEDAPGLARIVETLANLPMTRIQEMSSNGKRVFESNYSESFAIEQLSSNFRAILDRQTSVL
jgi:glycosyltransferase involved in cell wall biosynthesis